MSVSTTAQRRNWTIDDVRALGLPCDVPTAAQLLGISRSLSYRMVQDGTFPVRVLRLCRSVRVSVPDLLAYLGAPLTTTAQASGPQALAS